MERYLAWTYKVSLCLKATVMELVRYLRAEFTTLAATPETKKSPSTMKNFFHDLSMTACRPSPPLRAIRREMNDLVTSITVWMASSIASLDVIPGMTMRRIKAMRLRKVASTAATFRFGAATLASASAFPPSPTPCFESSLSEAGADDDGVPFLAAEDAIVDTFEPVRWLRRSRFAFDRALASSCTRWNCSAIAG